MNWPAFFPNDCPPGDAKPASGLFYRVVPEKKQRDLKAEDFYSHRKKQPDRVWPPDRCPCSLCGVSVMETLEDSLRLAQLLLIIPAFRNKTCFIAKGTLAGHHGLIKHTPDIEKGLLSHHDWWVPDACDPSPVFEYCKEQVKK
jgi:hypothetical protein